MRSIGMILLALTMSVGGMTQSAHAHNWHVGVNYYARPHCVADYYGWNGPVGGFGNGYYV